MNSDNSKFNLWHSFSYNEVTRKTMVKRCLEYGVTYVLRLGPVYGENITQTSDERWLDSGASGTEIG